MLCPCLIGIYFSTDWYHTTASLDQNSFIIKKKNKIQDWASIWNDFTLEHKPGWCFQTLNTFQAYWWGDNNIPSSPLQCPVNTHIPFSHCYIECQLHLKQQNSQGFEEILTLSGALWHHLGCVIITQKCTTCYILLQFSFFVKI